MLGSHRSVGQAEIFTPTYNSLASHTYMLHTEMCTLCTENYDNHAGHPVDASMHGSSVGQPSPRQVVKRRCGQESGQSQESEAAEAGDDGTLRVVAETSHVVANRGPIGVCLPVSCDQSYRQSGRCRRHQSRRRNLQ